MSSINVIASITFKLCWGCNRAVLVHCYIKLVSIKKNVHLSKTTDRFKINSDCKTAFTTTRVYIEKLFKFKACTEQIPMMKCVL